MICLLHLLWWNLYFAAEKYFDGIWLFFFIYLALVKLEELLTDDQILFRVSIDLWASVASLQIA